MTRVAYAISAIVLLGLSTAVFAESQSQRTVSAEKPITPMLAIPIAPAEVSDSEVPQTVMTDLEKAVMKIVDQHYLPELSAPRQVIPSPTRKLKIDTDTEKYEELGVKTGIIATVEESKDLLRSRIFFDLLKQAFEQGLTPDNATDELVSQAETSAMLSDMHRLTAGSRRQSGGIGYWTSTWDDEEINWTASVADSKYTWTASFLGEEIKRENAVFYDLEYTWWMSGSANVWPELMDAAGKWYYSGETNGQIITTFNEVLMRDNRPRFKQGPDRLIKHYETKNRIRWRTNSSGTVKRFQQIAKTAVYNPPDESGRNHYGAYPRVDGDSFSSHSVGFPGWRHIEERNRKSSGYVMDPGVQDGRVLASANTGINGGDRVNISSDGMIQFVSKDGFYYASTDDYKYTLDTSVMAVFYPASGGAPKTYWRSSFPRTFSERGSLYLYLRKPSWEHWTANFARGGVVANISMQRSADQDNDGLTDYEEMRGIPGYKTGSLRRSDPTKADTDGDGVNDFDEVFGWKYIDRRTKNEQRHTDTDPSRPDDAYAKIFLKNATHYKKPFRNHDVSYAAAIAMHDQQSEDEMNNAYMSCVAGVKAGLDCLLDVVYEAGALSSLKGQEILQDAYETRYYANNQNGIDLEVGRLVKAAEEFDKGARVFLGDWKRDSPSGALRKEWSLFKQEGPNRTPWDVDVGDDPSVSEPYREVRLLSNLMSDRIETNGKIANLRQLQSEGLKGNVATAARNEARKVLVSELTGGLLTQLILADQLPDTSFSGDSGDDTVARLQGRIREIESNYDLLERQVVNVLGVNPEFVQFIFHPESDPTQVPSNPQNNFLAYKQLLLSPIGSLELAKQADSEVDAANRQFEADFASFSTAIQQVSSTYDLQIDNLKLEFSGLANQVKRTKLALEKSHIEMRNIFSRIQIEQDRVARRAQISTEVGNQIAQVYLDTGEQLAANELALGDISAASATIGGFSSMFDGIVGAFTTGNPAGLFSGFAQTTWGPYAARAQARIAAANQRIQALEKAKVQYLNIELQNRVEQANSEAAIKSMLLESANARIDIEMRILDVSDALSRVQAVANMVLKTQAQKAVASRQIANLFGDPTFRLIRDAKRERAEMLFERARRDVFLAVRALEYETTLPYTDLRGNVILARSANELIGISSQLENQWTQFTAAFGSRLETKRTISIRKDVLGFRYGDTDSTTGEQLDPEERFRTYLKETSPAPKIYGVTFYGAMNEWGSDPGSPDETAPVTWEISRSVFNSKIQSVSICLNGNKGDAGDGGPTLGDDTATIFVNLGSHSWVRSVNGTTRPPADATDFWNYPENVVKNLVIRYKPQFIPDGNWNQAIAASSASAEEIVQLEQLLELIGPTNLRSSPLYNVLVREEIRTVPVSVGQCSILPKNYWGLFNRSPVRRWQLTLNLAEAGNTDIDIDALEDILLEITFRHHDLPSTSVAGQE